MPIICATWYLCVQTLAPAAIALLSMSLMNYYGKSRMYEHRYAACALTSTIIVISWLITLMCGDNQLMSFRAYMSAILVILSSIPMMQTDGGAPESPKLIHLVMTLGYCYVCWLNPSESTCFQVRW